jgi:hypothetical protein
LLGVSPAGARLFGLIRSLPYPSPPILLTKLFLHLPFPSFDACRQANGADAPIILRALFGRSKLVRFFVAYVRTLRYGPMGRQWFCPLLPKQKWIGCRAETRQHQTYRIFIELGGVGGVGSLGSMESTLFVDGRGA